jgi:glycosyltransferase involved in cell wall biosynthesis
MLFSILIANYNNSRFLETAIKSVLQQSYTKWEIILVDDGSTDEFENAIDQFTTDSRIKIFRNRKNTGCGYTKRRCAAKASGDILGFLDPDDALDTDALRIMVEAHVQHPECSIIHSTHYICDDSLTIKKTAPYPRALPANTPYLLLNDGSVHAFATFKKSCYNKTDGISSLNKKAVDQDLYYKLEETGNILFINKPLYFYRIHKGAISNAGQEAAATLAHYSIIEEACLRRIKKLQRNYAATTIRYWKKKYRTRYYKIRILHSFRKRNWLGFSYSLVVFPFVGGLQNIVSYCRKLPKEGIALIRRSFITDYEIKAD